MTDKIKLLEEIIESCTDKYGDNRNEIAKALFLLNEIKAAINYTQCCGDVVCVNCDGWGYTVDENGRRKDHCKECD